MKQLLVFFAILVLVQGISLHNRILGGQIAEPGQFPFIASLHKASAHKHFCAASIISRNVLLAAAHCKVYDASEIIAVVGITKQDDTHAKSYEVESYIIHENYNHSAMSNDVAVIILKQDIEFGDLIQAIALPSQAVLDDERLVTAGWGLISYPGDTDDYPNELYWMKANVMPRTTCNTWIDDPAKNNLTGKICTLEEVSIGICTGDSGGPLINSKEEIVGITSDASLCALGVPDFFTDVFYFKDWIVLHADL